MPAKSYLSRYLFSLVIITLINIPINAQVDSLAEGNYYLEKGIIVEQELITEKNQAYKLRLGREQFVQITVEHQGVNIALSLFAPDNQLLVRVNLLSLPYGTQALNWIAQQEGEYRLELSAVEQTAPPGRFKLRIEKLHSATREDKDRVSAQEKMLAGDQLLKKNDKESTIKGITLYQEALQCWQTLGDKTSEVLTLLTLSTSYQVINDFKKASEILERALLICRDTGKRYEESYLLNNRAMVYYSTGETSKALEDTNQALLILRETKNRSGEAIALSNLGNIYTSMGEMQKALECYTNALPLERLYKDEYAESYTLNNIGSLYGQIGELQKSLDNFFQALALKQKIGDLAGEAQTLSNIGTLYNMLGDRQKALDYYNRALPKTQALGNKSQEAFILNNLGGLCSSSNELEKAIAYHNQALKICQSIGDRYGESYALNLIASAYILAKKDMQKALELCNQALVIKREIADRPGEADALDNIGSVYSILNDKQNALHYYNQALKLRRITDNPLKASFSLFHIAQIEHKLGEFDKARANLQNVINTIETQRRS
ncbi:MAG: tetratricopeptide repeat protein, partial [Acidobacteriota bacterium]